MEVLQAYKYELMPTGEQARDMRRFAGARRFVYNKALALQNENHKAGEKFVGYVGMAKHLTEWRNGTETPWLADAPVHTQQQTLKDLDRAFSAFFKACKGQGAAQYPQFKRKGMGDSFRYPDPKQIKLDQIRHRRNPGRQPFPLLCIRSTNPCPVSEHQDIRTRKRTAAMATGTNNVHRVGQSKDFG